MYVFKSEYFSDYESGIEKEWLITNGIGGYASSTIIGANTRTYHGLLISALNPPVDRTLMLSSIDEEIYIDDRVHKLATHKFPMTIHPEGYRYLKRVSFNPFPDFEYQVENIEIFKQIFMEYGKNTTIISYQITCDMDNAILKLIPLINLRNFHHTTKSEDIEFEQDFGKNGTKITGNSITFNLHSNAKYYPESAWYYNVEFDIERYRGLDYQEDNYNPGFFEIELEKGVNHVFVVASTNEIQNLKWNDIVDIYDGEVKRVESSDTGSK